MKVNNDLKNLYITGQKAKENENLYDVNNDGKTDLQDLFDYDVNCDIDEDGVITESETTFLKENINDLTDKVMYSAGYEINKDTKEWQVIKGNAAFDLNNDGIINKKDLDEFDNVLKNTQISAEKQASLNVFKEELSKMALWNEKPVREEQNTQTNIGENAVTDNTPTNDNTVDEGPSSETKATTNDSSNNKTETNNNLGKGTKPEDKYKEIIYDLDIDAGKVQLEINKIDKNLEAYINAMVEAGVSRKAAETDPYFLSLNYQKTTLEIEQKAIEEQRDSYINIVTTKDSLNVSENSKYKEELDSLSTQIEKSQLEILRYNNEIKEYSLALKTGGVNTKDIVQDPYIVYRQSMVKALDLEINALKSKADVYADIANNYETNNLPENSKYKERVDATNSQIEGLMLENLTIGTEASQYIHAHIDAGVSPEVVYNDPYVLGRSYTFESNELEIETLKKNLNFYTYAADVSASPKLSDNSPDQQIVDDLSEKIANILDEQFKIDKERAEYDAAYKAAGGSGSLENDPYMQAKNSVYNYLEQKLQEIITERDKYVK